MLRIKTDKQFFSWDRAVVMGVMNVTPDSFYDGGRYQGIDAVLNQCNKMVEEGVEPEFIGIINYSAMAIIQLQLGVVEHPDIDFSTASDLYHKVLDSAFELMSKKNHDYDEAWRSMRVSSMTDLILMKLLRIKEIEDNDGKTLISEGLDANYFDIINYAVFCLILINENK